MLKDYFNYVQNVLGAKSFLLPLAEQEVTETVYHFAVATLTDETREILKNIVKALKAKKFDILELKIERALGHETPAHGLASKVNPLSLSKSILIIFGRETADFLIPNTPIELGQSLLLSGSQTLLTYSIEEMRELPALKREAWQHLKPFIHP